MPIKMMCLEEVCFVDEKGNKLSFEQLERELELEAEDEKDGNEQTP